MNLMTNLSNDIVIIPKIHLPFPSSTGNQSASGHCFSYGSGIPRATSDRKFSDSQIQRHHIKDRLNDPLLNQPVHSSRLRNYNQNSSDTCITEYIRHQLQFASITGGAGGVTTTSPLGRTYNQSSTNLLSINQQAFTVTHMLADTGHSEKKLAEQLQLSSYQIHLLQQSWQRLRCSSNFFINVFRTVISKNAIAKELFRKTSIIDGFTSYKCYDIKEHANSLIELIDFALQEIHSPIKVVQERCMVMGASHCHTCENSMSSAWDQFGDSLAEAIAKAEAVRGKRKCLKAWNALLSFIVDRIKGGYSAESKRRASKKSSTQENAGPSSSSSSSQHMSTTVAPFSKYNDNTATKPTAYH
ncbi:Globin-like protein [Dirofilaria immitis]